jgi:hypothetical protein
MNIESIFVSQLLVGNLTYVLLIVSMLMTRMIWLRIFAICAGTVGATYAWFWLHDPISTIWEVMFTLVNIVQISLVSYRNATSMFSVEEQAFYDIVVPALEPYQVRRLLSIGEWQDAPPGTRLIEQGSIVSHLIFIGSGKVDILSHGTALSSCGAGQLIGEISAVGAEMVPATASAVVSDSIRYLALERSALDKVKNSDPSIGRAIEVCGRQSLRDKLVQMNSLALN